MYLPETYLYNAHMCVLDVYHFSHGNVLLFSAFIFCYLFSDFIFCIEHNEAFLALVSTYVIEHAWKYYVIVLPDLLYEYIE